MKEIKEIFMNKEYGQLVMFVLGAIFSIISGYASYMLTVVIDMSNSLTVIHGLCTLVWIVTIITCVVYGWELNDKENNNRRW